MKKTLLIAFVALCTGAKAQYFQHTYGNNNVWDVLCDGITPQAGVPGYFMTGVTNPINLPGELIIVRTDAAGGLGCSTCYNRRMPIILPGVINKTLEVNQARCVERNPVDPNLAGVIAVVGGWVNNTAGTAGIFYTDFAQPGGLNAGPYNISVSGYNLQLGSVAKGANDMLYITGTAYASGTRNLFVVKFNMATYTIVWGKVYDILPVLPDRNNEDAYDIVGDLTNPGVIYVVGRIGDYNGTSTAYNGFVLSINANTGVAANADIYGTGGQQDYFSSISPSASLPAGYVLGGYTDDPLTTRADMWAMKIDQSNAVVWNTKRGYDPGLPLVADESSMDVIEHLNSSGSYEYYQVGTTQGSVYGGMDMIVYRLDNSGNNVANGQFTYQGGGNDEGQAIDFANPSSGGLAVFGTYEYTSGSKQKEFYLVRADYDGITACSSEVRNLLTPQYGPGYITSLSVSGFGTFSKSNFMSALPSVNDNDDEICYAQTVGGPIHNRTASPETGGVLISPNPMGQNNATAIVTLEAAADEQVTVAIYDVLGKQYYINTVMLKNGQNSLPLDLSNAGMAPGIYRVRISGEATNETIVLLVK